jgi:hypothetical protein
MDLTQIPIDECIRRDRCRGNDRVGRAVIENMALRYNLLPKLQIRTRIAIFDIDGTLANIDHRLNISDGKGKIMHPSALKQYAMQDRLNTPVADWLCSAQKDVVIFIVSGRGTDEAVTTDNWLLQNRINPDRIFMRQGGDNRADTIVKQEILTRIDSIYGKYSIEFVVDDRPAVVQMWRNNGLKVYPVNQESWEGRE